MNEEIGPFLKSTLPTTQVELTLSGKNLLNTDILSKSDPFCLISMKESWQNRYFEIARTEVIQDTLNPEWVKKVILNYNFETIQKLRFELRDEDDGDYDFLGVFETTLSELVSFSGRQFVGKLNGQTGQDFGEIIVVCEEVASCKQIAEIQFNAVGLPSSGWLCLGLTGRDAFLVISRSNEDGSYSVVSKTEVAHGTQNPLWKPFSIRATTLCNGDFDRTIKIDCYDHKNDGDHKLIGTCYSSLRSLSAQNEPPMILINERKRKEDPNHSAGVLKVYKARIVEEVTFLDYIKNGTQMHFAVAIDFTASNGVHTDPNSLHFLSSQRLNFYELALRGVGDIIQYYDSAKMFPAFGFGAKTPPTFQVSHQFPLNGNPAHPYCTGIEEILVQYRNQLSMVQLYGPTNFAPVINNTATIATQFQDGRHYFVLLIITDGQISDLHETKRAIINASALPISIIIVGVGNAEFDNMDALDSDDALLSAGGQRAKRDIVQFVPLNKYLSRNGPDQFIKSQADLAKEVLAEIPQQLTSFMKSHGIKPQNATSNVPPNNSNIVPTAPMS
ncbi:copine-8-like [Sitodiplosis mosellana]|uniref:copine-8-like n=1 Tax=Sitodiplosis mosellana TaxID=263140 RepID=UPI002444680B|nr:copine-8-like [Sitodiplosis mosellana]